MKRALLLILVVACGKANAPDHDTSKADRSRDDTRGGPGNSAGSGSVLAPNTGKGGPIGQGGGVTGIDLDGAIEVGAGIDKDIVRKVVKDNTQKLQYCYEKTLLANPGIEGKVTATFTIGTDGSVGDVKTAGVHPDVEACVADAVKAFRFPPSQAKVEVSYPFTFKPA
jgi:TonB family protein